MSNEEEVLVVERKIIEKIGMFNFWDSDYIPKCLEPFVLRPPKHREPVDELQNEIEALLK